MDLIELIFWILTAYVGIGIIFSIVFVIRGVQTIDPAAKGTGIGFKLIILPGMVALWPIFARRWSQGISEPPEEANEHRIAARGYVK